MTGRFDDKTILVTGGLSGIGAAACEMLAARGARVIAGDLSASATDLSDAAVAPLRLDVGDPASVEAAVAATMARDGRIDGVVNSAGIGILNAFLDTSVETFDRIIAVNLRGTFLVGQATARAMVRTGGGSIVNIGSISGLIGSADRAAYGASKGGVTNLSKVMATELAHYGIRVNVVAPGPVEGPMAAQAHSGAMQDEYVERVSLRRYAQPSEIASAIAYLLSDEASYVTGQVLAVDGGFTSQGLAAPVVARRDYRDPSRD